MKIIYAGTPSFAVPILEALLQKNPPCAPLYKGGEYDVIAVYTQPDKPAGRGKHEHMSPVKQTALAHHIPVYQPISLRDPLAQAELEQLKPDLMIVAAYGLILPQCVLDIPVFGCINVHASLLPRWRGASPVQQAILAGDPETGVSIMRMEAGLDTGPVYYKKTCAILPTDTAEILHDKLALLGAEALVEILPDIIHKIPEPQDADYTTYAKKIAKQDGLIDWADSAFAIERKVRAFNPWPVAYCENILEKTMRIWAGEALQKDAVTALPGTVLAMTADGIDIAAGENTVFRIKQLQLPNAKIISGKDYFNAHR